MGYKAAALHQQSAVLFFPHRKTSTSDISSTVTMPQTIPSELQELLDQEATRINNPSFIDSDPVRFPRMFSSLQDIEITALLCSSIAWGNRKMICNNCGKMLALMGHDPYRYVMDEAYEELPDGNIHRTFFACNMRHYLRGLHRIYSRHSSIDAFASASRLGECDFAPWRLAEAINRELAMANDGKGDSRCLPLGLDTTALKRLNMALRWLVRKDGIVDLGVWDSIKPSQLYIPLDVHVGNTARQLGLVSRRANDRRTTVELTETLRSLRPEDPAFYDYALFGIGIESKAAGSCTPPRSAAS